MKKRIFALMVACALVLNVVNAAFAGDNAKENERQTQQLAAQLPASDAVITFNSQRFFNEALPQVLSANQPLLGRIVGKIDEIKSKTGVDLRQFEQFALGVSNKQVSAQEMSFDPVILARSSFDVGGVISLAKLALNGKYREEKIGDKTIYIFTPPPSVSKSKPQNNKPQGKSSVFEKAMDKMFDNLSSEFAVAAFDNNTLAIGSTARVRETFQTKTRVGADILSLVNRKPNALLNFGAVLPNGMKSLLNLDNDEIGKNIDSIHQISGALDFADRNASLSLLARTFNPDQAQSLRKNLTDLQQVGKMILGGAKDADKKVFSRMVENARITGGGSDVMIDLQVPQTDIDILVGLK